MLMQYLPQQQDASSNIRLIDELKLNRHSVVHTQQHASLHSLNRFIDYI